MGERKLTIVADDQQTAIDELREEFREFREEVRLWQAATCGVVAGISLILGALVMALS